MKNRYLFLFILPIFVQAQDWDTSTPGQITYAGGNVGVGTNDPKNGKLQINADSNLENALRLQIGRFSMGGSSEFQMDAVGVHGGRMTVLENGNVGLGIVDPQVRLQVRDGQIMVGNSYGQGGTVFFGNINHGVKRISNQVQLFTAGGEESGFSFANSGFASSPTIQMKITNTGNVGIGTTIPTHKLEVNGMIRSQGVKCEAAPWPDYVFESDYSLPSIESVETFIEANHRLPDLPSAAEVEADGIELGEMNRLLVQKVEELTLYLIEANKEKEVLRQQLKANSEQLKTKDEELKDIRQELKANSQRLNANTRQLTKVINQLNRQPKAKSQKSKSKAKA